MIEIVTVIAWVVLGLAVLGLGVSSWIVVPAPTMSLLPLAVATPEISLLLGMVQGAIAIVTLMLPWTDHGWLIAGGCSVLGIALSSIPLWQVVTTIRQTQVRMQAVLGKDYNDRIPAVLQNRMRSQPFVPLDIVRGIPLPQDGVACDRIHIPTPDGHFLALDLYRPTASIETDADPLPLIVTIYGGAWRVGQPEDTTAFSRYMTAQGYGVAAISYRHVPDYRFPTQLEDVQTSLRWLASHGAAYQLDPTRLALVGWSAGAHLALLAAYQSAAYQSAAYQSAASQSAGHQPATLPVRAVVNYYGPVNLAQGYRDRPRPDPINVQSILEDFLGGGPDDCPEQYQTASPLHWVQPGLPPTLSLYGDRDHLVKPIFGQQLDHKLQANGNQSVLIRLPWSEHAFDRVWQGMGNQIALYCVERFLAYTLQADSL